MLLQMGTEGMRKMTNKGMRSKSQQGLVSKSKKKWRQKQLVKEGSPYEDQPETLLIREEPRSRSSKLISKFQRLTLHSKLNKHKDLRESIPTRNLTWEAPMITRRIVQVKVDNNRIITQREPKPET